jgi:hypothetical protein
MSNKVFSQALYERYNQRAIDAASTFFTQQGFQIIVPEQEAYAAYDFHIEKDGIQYPIEVEVSTNWKKDEWQGYTDFHMPYRKRHSKACLYLRFNEQCSSFAMGEMEVMKRSPVKTTNNKEMKRELFFAVPLDKLKLYNKQDKWTFMGRLNQM